MDLECGTFKPLATQRWTGTGKKGDHSHMTVVLFWIALFLIAIVAFLITARVQAVKWLNGVSLLIPSFIIFFSSGVLLHYPLYVEAIISS